MPTVPTCATTGSSPLARGLRHDGRRQGGGDGIIPARAGFTARGGGRRRPRQDHPRSRGVYTRAICWLARTLGSSPLARGLLHSGPIAAGQVRIIPARAGFTSTACLHPILSRDHPRSRGVYGHLLGMTTSRSGSSPLARGLLKSIPGAHYHHRIIPARAGFTPAGGRRVLVGPDHPRSRGVYARSATISSRSTGSSPLARGLQWE